MALMESLPFATWFKDENGSFNHANALLLASLDKKPEQVIGKMSSEVFEADDARQNEEGDQDVITSRKISESTFSRAKRIIKAVHFPVKDEEGTITGTGGYQEDITSLTASLQMLHRERETLEVLLESMPFCIFFTDRIADDDHHPITWSLIRNFDLMDK